MPNRVIKESLRRSSTCAQMTGDEERHWVRGIILGCDDHGCLEITPEILKGVAYPRHKDVTEQDILGWNERMEQLGCIRTWLVGDHQYAEVINWNEQSGACFTDEGKRTRNRRITPIPPDWAKVTRQEADNTPLYSETSCATRSQSEPVGASARPVPVPVPVPVSLSSNVEVTNPSPLPVEDQPAIGQPRTHTNTPTDTDLLVDYATEVLNKVEGVYKTAPREDRGTILKIARHAPTSIVKKALMDLQDVNQRGELKRAGPYFSARVTTLCVTAGIKSPFGKMEVERATAAN